MKKILFTFSLSLLSLFALAQAGTEQIQYYKGRIIYRGQEIPKPKQIRSLLLEKPSPSPELEIFVKKYRNNNNIALTLATLGGGAIGYSLGGVLGGAKINPGLLAAGAGLLGIGLAFDSNGRKNLKLAVAAYNK
ncbi:hypothetical protein [Dyadobacter bucti]|jgi:hypothetical protein|uniref:hypothetical protein n=1 Tax=Dyadobacter bucti TaxID=2572203 RepID=UPI003F6EE69A